MWVQSSVARLGVDYVIEAAAKTGCDLKPIRDLLEDLAKDGGMQEAARGPKVVVPDEVRFGFFFALRSKTLGGT